MADAPSIIAAYLDATGIPYQRVGRDLFALSLSGERKKTIPVVLFARERTLVVECFFMRSPLENREAAYRLLLARNARQRSVHFALGERDDVYLVGTLGIATLDAQTIDELLGEILTTADEMFDAALAIGFETYLAHDLAWRERQRSDG